MCIVAQAESRSKGRETVTGIWRGRPESRRTSNRSCALPFEGGEVIHGTHSEGTRGINDTISVFFFLPPFNLLMDSPLTQSIWKLGGEGPHEAKHRAE